MEGRRHLVARREPDDEHVACDGRAVHRGVARAAGVDLDALARVRGGRVPTRRRSETCGAMELQASVGSLQGAVGWLQAAVGLLQAEFGSSQASVGSLHAAVGSSQAAVGSLQTLERQLQAFVGGSQRSIGPSQGAVGSLATPRVPSHSGSYGIRL